MKDPEPVDNIEECARDCVVTNPSCLRFSYYLGFCFLYEEYSGEITRKNAVSGIFVLTNNFLFRSGLFPHILTHMAILRQNLTTVFCFFFF